MRRVKRILSSVLVLSMCFTLFFFPCFEVKADDATYFEYENQSYIYLIHRVYNNIDNEFYSNNNGRLVCIHWSNRYVYYFVSESSGNYKVVNSNNHSEVIQNGNLSSESGYYVSQILNLYYTDAQNPSDEIPIVESDTLSNSVAVYYTYGEGAIAPEPPGPSWGKPYDVEYSTRIAGSGLASADNIDRIVWNPAVDTNGNELPTGARVQIRAIPGKYVGNTANDVLTKTYTDFVLDHSKQLIIVDIIASRGVYETKWSEVVDHFGFFPYSWVPNIQYIDNEYFKMGWIYQIRLQVDDYYSDWTNIYTATGSGASESQTITDSDEISQQLIQDINIVNQLNNTTTTNWYINETTINNSEYTENTNGKPWWAYLLEAILSLFQIGDGDQQTINNTNNLNIDLNDKLNEYNEIEDQQLDNLDTNLEAIEVESDMLENNKFVGSANWVAQQYTRMTNGTVIGSLIGFSLLFGLALIFIGKIR